MTRCFEVNGKHYREDEFRKVLATAEFSKYTGVSFPPVTPFKTSWSMLVMKRMIQEAAERGFDRIGWTTGAMQAARYDLSKQVSKIGHGKNPDGTFAIKVISTDGTNMWESEKATINEIEEQLGKEMAEKIAASDDLKWKTIEGDGLKVGGKGMIGFYDDILPAAVNKFVKKWGVKVGTSKIAAGKKVRKENIEGDIVRYRKDVDVHSLDINDAMIADAAEGMPLFSASGPQVNYERPKGGAVGSWVRWMFTSASDLPKQAFALKENMQQFIAAHERAMSFAISDLRKAVKKTYGSMPKTNSAEWSAINDVLRGGDIKTLPARMRDPIWRMRSHIDNLSKMIIESGVANENLEATIEENMGVYLTRTYRVHADRKWAKRVPLEVRTRAEDWIRDQLALENGRLFPPTESEVKQRVNELLYTDTAAESPMGIIAQGKLGSKLLDVLKARKELPIELRELWGEETNPLINYAASVAKMTKLLAGQRFLTEARQSGLGKWLFEANDPNIDPEAKATIAAPGSDVMNPLNGLKTYPEVKVAFETEFARQDLPAYFKLYLGMNSLAKAMKTVGSLTTHFRNFASNLGFAVANGHWRLTKAADAIAGAIPTIEGVPLFHIAGRGAAKLAKAFVGGEVAGKKYDAWREFHLRLIKNGVIGEDVAVGEFKKLLSDANLENMGRLSDNIAMKIVRGTAESAAKMYQLGDAVWKVYAWGNERARYQAAFPEWSDEQLDKHAADIVRNTMPTYSKIPKGVQAMRHIPVGNFFSWSSEIIRVTLKTNQLAMEELRDPRTRKIGATRLAGITAMTILPEAIAAYSLYSMGMTKKDDEDKREFLPPWSKNSNIYWMGDGKYIDVSFGDSYAYLRKAVHAYMRGDEKGVVNGIVESAKELADPFFTEQLLGERIADVLVRNGETSDGRKVYNKEDDVTRKAGLIFKHILAPLVPGAFISGSNIKKGIDGEVIGRRGKVYDTMIELIALFGVRISKIDIGQSLTFKVGDHDRAITDSNRLFSEVATNAGKVSTEDLTDAYDRAETARRRNFDNMHAVAWKAIRQGVSEAEVRSTLKGNGLSKEDADRVISGKYAPLMPSAPSLAEIAGKPDGEDRVTEIYRLFITRSTDPEAAEESVRDKLGKRLKSANTTIRRSKLVDAQIQRLKPKAGETADERRERLADYQRTLQRAKRAKESISKLQAEEFGVKRVP